MPCWTGNIWLAEDLWKKQLKNTEVCNTERYIRTEGNKHLDLEERAES